MRRRTARRIVWTVLAATLLATGGACYPVYQDRVVYKESPPPPPPRDTTRPVAPPPSPPVRVYSGAAKVCFYSGLNYTGSSYCAAPGIDTNNASKVLIGGNYQDWNDRISSIQIRGSAEVMVFTDPHYMGTSLRMTVSEPDLSQVRTTGHGVTNWRFRISSYNVRRAGQGHAGAKACFYSRPGFRGASYCAGLGLNTPDASAIRMADGRIQNWNNRIASVEVVGRGYVRLRVWREKYFGGTSLAITHSAPDLARIHTTAGTRNWFRKVSSYKVMRR